MAKTMRVLAGLMAVAPLFAQAPVQRTAMTRVRIISQSTWNQMNHFSSLSEVRLKGVVEQVEGGTVQLRLAFGMVRVEMGKLAATQVVRAGESLEILASKIVVEGSQHLVAMEVLNQG